MPMFIVRVELHHVDQLRTDYRKLHLEMESLGFLRTIKSDAGEPSRLPEGEYFIDRDLTNEQVLANARTAALKIDPDHSILVTQATKCTYYGLKPA